MGLQLISVSVSACQCLPLQADVGLTFTQTSCHSYVTCTEQVAKIKGTPCNLIQHNVLAKIQIQFLMVIDVVNDYSTFSVS